MKYNSDTIQYQKSPKHYLVLFILPYVLSLSWDPKLRLSNSNLLNSTFPKCLTLMPNHWVSGYDANLWPFKLRLQVKTPPRQNAPPRRDITPPYGRPSILSVLGAFCLSLGSLFCLILKGRYVWFRGHFLGVVLTGYPLKLSSAFLLFVVVVVVFVCFSV